MIQTSHNPPPPPPTHTQQLQVTINHQSTVLSYNTNNNKNPQLDHHHHSNNIIIIIISYTLLEKPYRNNIILWFPKTRPFPQNKKPPMTGCSQHAVCLHTYIYTYIHTQEEERAQGHIVTLEFPSGNGGKYCSSGRGIGGGGGGKRISQVG